jgi:DNA-binding Lrp family transcriptional regulator
MPASGNIHIEKYLMDKRIISILKRAPKRGIWMKELALRLKISRPLLNYYLFGMKKAGIIKGGRVRNNIIVRDEGNNRFISLKDRSCQRMFATSEPS